MRKIALGSLALLILTGCNYKYEYSKAPYPVKHQATEQYELQSAYHWKVMAEDFANELDKKIYGKIYLDPKTNINSKFSKNFINLLRSELIKRDKLVVKDTKDAIKIKLNIDVVKFNSDRDKKAFPYKLTLLTTGLWVVSAINSPVVGAALATQGVVVGEYVYNKKYNKFYSSVPKYEIVVNAYAYRDNKYLTAVDRIYYVADKDVNLYKEKVDDSTIIYLRGDNEAK